MKIIFISNNYTPYAGGVVSSINSSIDYLRKCGHTVHLITLDFLGNDHDDPEWVIRVPCPIKFKYKDNHMAVPLRAQTFVLQKVQELKPDLIHVHHPFLLGSVGVQVGKQLAIPVVFTYHTMYQEYAHYVPLPEMLTKPVIKKLALDFCNQVNGVIVPSATIAQYLKEHAVTTPMRVIPSSIHERFFNNREKNYKTVRGEPRRIALLSSVEGHTNPLTLDSNVFELLLVSRFRKEKNIPFVLDVISKLDQSQYRLTLVGYGEQYDALKAYAYDELKLSKDAVRFILKPEKDVLVQLYADADLFLFPSQTDTQGLVLAEAMAGGLPIIALDGPGQSDIIENGVNGYIVSDQASMISRITAIKDDGKLYEKLSHNARKAADNYAGDKIIQQLESFYKTFLIGN